MIYRSAANPENPQPLQELLQQVQFAGMQRKTAADVTGVLLACEGRFLGVLEGPKDKVREVYGAISCDPRHISLSIISDHPVPARRFQDWRLCCGRFEDDDETFWREPAFNDGFRPAELSPASALGLLSVVRDLTEAPPRKELDSRYPCVLAGACLDEACASGAAAACQLEPPGA